MYEFTFIPDKSNEADYNLSSLLKVAKRPSIPAIEEVIIEQELGDGTKAYKHTGVYKDRVIPVECNFVQRNPLVWNNHFGYIQNALLRGAGVLIFSDDRDHYWRVKKVEFDNEKRSKKIIGEFVINFTVEPFRYLTEYINYRKVGSTIMYQGYLGGIFFSLYSQSERTSKPIFKIVADNFKDKTFFVGLDTIQTFDMDFEFRIDVSNVSKDRMEIYIDTEKMCVYSNDEEAVIKVQGSYEELYLKSGKKSIDAIMQAYDLESPAYFTIYVKERVYEF